MEDTPPRWIHQPANREDGASPTTKSDEVDLPNRRALDVDRLRGLVVRTHYDHGCETRGTSLCNERRAWAQVHARGWVDRLSSGDDY